MASRRIYITLNDEKDKVIIDYLSNFYSEKDAIKQILYRLATKSDTLMQNDDIVTEKVQSVPNSNNKVKKNIKPKRNKSVQKDDISTVKDKKVSNTNSTLKVQKGEISNKEDNDILLDLSTIEDGYNDIPKKDSEDSKMSKVEENSLAELRRFQQL